MCWNQKIQNTCLTTKHCPSILLNSICSFLKFLVPLHKEPTLQMLTLRTKRIETGTCKEMINQTLFTVVSFFSGTCRRAEYQYIKKKKGGFKPPGIQIIQVFRACITQMTKDLAKTWTPSHCCELLFLYTNIPNK